jgi:hypothetical protein
MSSGCSFYDTRQLSAKIVVGEESLTKFEKILIGFSVSTLRQNPESLIGVVHLKRQLKRHLFSV